MSRQVTFNNVTFIVDFSDDEWDRRTNEMVRRACGQPATFDLETGQPFNGPKLIDEELQRRGYDCRDTTGHSCEPSK